MLTPALVAISYGLLGDSGDCDPSDEVYWGPVVLGLVFLAPALAVGTLAGRRLLQPERAISARSMLVAQLAHLPFGFLAYAVLMFVAFGR